MHIVTATMTATTVLPLLKSLSILKNGELAVRQRLKKTDPSHSNCFGEECFRLPTSFGTIIGWRITNDLRETALDLQDTFLRLINEKRPYWHSYRPRNDTVPFQEPVYSVDCFLIGPDQSHASPHVTIVTTYEWVATHLKAIVIGSKILQNFARWGCFKLPAYITLTSPAASNVSLSQSDNLPGQSSRYDICISGEIIPRHLDGELVEVWKDDLYIGSATVGGFLAVGHQILALSTAHTFYPRQPPPKNTFEIDESELEFLSSDSLTCEGDDGDFGGMHWQPGLSAQWFPSSHRTTSHLVSKGSTLHTTESDFETKTTIGYLERISSIHGADTHNCNGLDWALITITHPNIVLGNKLHHWNMKQITLETDERIEILTASTAITTEIVSNAAFGLSLNTLPQPVLVANTGSTTQGDSGSWAFRLRDKKAVGMLIGNCQSLSQCYLLSMNDILSNVEAQIGLPAKVAPSKLFGPLEQRNFLSFVNNQKCCDVDESGNEVCYITALKLQEYWSRERVSIILNCFGEPGNLTFDAFLQRYLRLFSVLMYIDQPEQFCWFLHQAVDDSHLPYKRDGQSSFGVEDLLDLFEEKQWIFCPLESHKSHVNLAKNHPRIVHLMMSQEMPESENSNDCSNAASPSHRKEGSASVATLMAVRQLKLRFLETQLNELDMYAANSEQLELDRPSMILTQWYDTRHELLVEIYAKLKEHDDMILSMLQDRIASSYISSVDGLRLRLKVRRLRLKVRRLRLNADRLRLNGQHNTLGRLRKMFLRQQWPTKARASNTECTAEVCSIDDSHRIELHNGKLVSLAVAVISILVAVVPFVGSITGLCLVTNVATKLGMIATFTAAFAFSIGLMTNASRAQILAATATYAAVLAVFVS